MNGGDLVLLGLGAIFVAQCAALVVEGWIGVSAVAHDGRMAQNDIHERHDLDDLGRPAGGVTVGRGFTIAWQNGPLVDASGQRQEPNGAFVEDVIRAAIGRIEHYESGQFACAENREALDHLTGALSALDQRTQRRMDQGVEGTHGLHTSADG